MSLLVKICGLSTRETLDAALEAGADMVGFVFFSAVAAPSQPRGGARTRQAGQGSRDKGGAHRRCRRRDARKHRRDAAAGSPAIARQGNHRARARHQGEVRASGHEGDCGRNVGRSCRAAGLCQRRRPHPVRRPRAEGRHPPRRAGRRVRLARSGKARPPAAVHGLGRAFRRQRRGGGPRHPRRRRRCVLRRGKRARRQGSRDDPHSRRTRATLHLPRAR